MFKDNDLFDNNSENKTTTLSEKRKKAGSKGGNAPHKCRGRGCNKKENPENSNSSNSNSSNNSNNHNDHNGHFSFNHLISDK